MASLLKDDALHEEEESLVDAVRADLGELPQREDLPHHAAVLHLVTRK